MFNNLKVDLYKKFLNFFILCFAIVTLTNCSNDNEKYNGSPVGKSNFQLITAEITTDETFVLPGQEVKFTATLPTSFRSIVNEEVTVEASAFSSNGVVRTSKITFPIGVSAVVGKIVVGSGASIFENNVLIKLTAINLSKPVLGTQFQLTSNSLDINSGSTSIPTENSKRLRIFVSWQNIASRNVMKCTIARVRSTAITFANAVLGSTIIKINGVNYPITFSTDLPTTAANFVLAYSSNPVLIGSGITFEALGNSVIINYQMAPGAVVVSTTPNGTTFSATKFDQISMNGDASNSNNPRIMDFYVSEIVLINGKSKAEDIENLFNPGNYIVKFGPNSATSLEPGIVNLKYRIVLRFPDASVKIFNGVYNNISYTTPPVNNPDINLKTIFTFDKTGFGENAIYQNFNFF